MTTQYEKLTQEEIENMSVSFLKQLYEDRNGRPVLSDAEVQRNLDDRFAILADPGESPMKKNDAAKVAKHIIAELFSRGVMSPDEARAASAKLQPALIG